MQEQASSLLDKTLSRLLPLWGEIYSGRRSLDKLSLTPDLNDGDAEQLKHWMDACLSDHGGEVAARMRAAALGRSFMELNDLGRLRFLTLLSENYGADEVSIAQLIEHWQNSKGEKRAHIASQLREALEPARMKLLTQFNELPEGIKFLVDMRADLLALRKQHPQLKPLESDLRRLLSAWFDVGLLHLERISWNSKASLLEKLIAYEAVHEIKSWNDLKNRLDSDRRCFAFFHPNMPDEPLIFVEVALVNGLAGNVQHLLDEDVPVLDISQADTAIFYSISNAQKGLAGISFGNFLIKRVVRELQSEFPQLKQFSTLSPVPGFCQWLKQLKEADPEQEGITLPVWLQSTLDTEFQYMQFDQHQQTFVEDLALHYLAREKRHHSEYALNPVAHFHLSNGARIERLNWRADNSDKGLQQSAGLMVNYLYELAEIEHNSRQYSDFGEISLSPRLKKQLKGLNL
ncbi:malonyl-CoA decarboxylase [Oceanospirillum sediminis]|uniref:Malonyl-CoA decarboxylase n=1 Tax=Oceanospirillum sediminis TaxID=2760088 RepID=A0A839ILX3_9GAMM|nr:malonyl-CoA decarboxylase [Oceanospirillum sediminis]MBB1486225.1 malonyl-CoA decarboxylase [Oceanospirillum sediminis]